ncbi:copper resistance protein CopC [Neobacillus pocheonensis]|uniref:copper resistance protein CopC n=1 Tax=Neobacillus pocheonensis TaxID=363869 RepID=UPI003D2C0718
MRVNRNHILLLTILFIFLFPTFPSAHAYIKKSTPTENEVFDQPPQKVTIQFDEAIQPDYHSLQVFDSKGKRVDQKNERIDPANPAIIEADLQGNLPNDTYSIQWRVVSGDGHPIEGVIPFQIGQEAKGTAIAPGSKGYMPKLDLIILRWLQYMSSAVYVGILFFYLFVLPKELGQEISVRNRFSKIIVYSFITLCFSIILSLPLQATIESGLSWGKVFHINVLGNMLTNSVFGKTWITAIIMLLILWPSTFLLCYKPFKKTIWAWVSLALGIGMLRTKTFTSHAASSEKGLLPIAMDFVHLLSASIWIGSLIAMIALLTYRKNQAYFETIRRFSKWGIAIVLILSATGLYGSLLYIPNWRSLVVTDYGRALLGKVILLVIMVLFAGVNFIKGKRSHEKGIQRSLWGEFSAGIIVLILSVILTNLPTAMASPGPINETNKVKGGNYITFAATPNVIGKNTFEVTLKDRNGQPIKKIEQVTLTFKSLEMKMGDDTVQLSRVKEGKYSFKGLNFNMSGRWNVRVHVLTKDLETMDTDFKVLVGSQ